jgi:lipopolysaccharide export LptBFGC system permease protein LptF
MSRRSAGACGLFFREKRRPGFLCGARIRWSVVTVFARYLLCEFGRVLLVAAASLTLLLTVVFAAREAVRVGVPLRVAFAGLPYFAVETLGYALPAAVLYAVCATLGRMAADGELLALKSAGVDPLRPVAVLVGCAYATSLAAVVSYDLTACWSRPGIRRVAAEAAAEVARGMLRTQRCVALPGCSVAVRDVRDDVLVMPCVRLAATAERPAAVLVAGQGRVEGDARCVKLRLTEAEVQIGDAARVVYPGEFALEFRTAAEPRPVHRDWLALREIPAALAALQTTADRLRRAAAEPIAGPAAAAELRAVERQIARIRAEPHRRWANAFSCVAFAVAGAAISLHIRQRDAWTAFFAAFLPILLAYYPLLMVSERLATSGRYGPALFWGADAALAAVGAALLLRWRRR